ncbi:MULTISPECIES: Sec-independent protein translocase subunit TatA [Streptomyces]|uniref:Sec-independent protein translocase protein TatA n=1 Tax=Streptomyces sudanensis TaxID=436397 RepID=A0ABY4TIH9_9ACTN|nr:MULTISPECIES: Sec-independent protein translocase subunit TatA [Streptomyces]MCP9959607.1 Sec-independent protein translocase subunit TatA [Streptomyces sudanensis]MCP9988665.1 Sec-independent protein translocase subunit TatA [Streptomyces sudanensis]MCP9999958.1 Sec-independent protein translocase subunit TatA [Streptomyces sudanensis]URN17939.1 Sec-independent protein translocase subunit TatA [Streptomyces sudanensis]
MGQVGIWHLAIVVGIFVLLFGAKKLPEVARSLGKSARILKSEAAAMKNDGASREDASQTGTAEQTAAPRTIQAAPGDVASARPVDESKRTAQG